MVDAPSSPTSRLKFLCRYGGRILPRPSDGLLRYVGGETRVLAVPRSITFAELKDKTTGMFNADVVVKYQLMAEDLDALVTVKTDDDLYYMLDEYDRLDRRPSSPTASSSPRFRLFLFPISAAVSPAAESAAPVEQRYLEAVNGDIPIPVQHHASRPHFSAASSAATSPTSTLDSSSASALLARANAGRAGAGGGGMHRVRSTPNLGDGCCGSGSGCGGSQPGSPRAYVRQSSGFWFGGVAGWRMGSGVRQELNGNGCVWGNGSSSSQVNRRYYLCSSPTTGGPPLGGLVEGSPPRRGGQVFQLCPPPPHAAPLRRPIWE